MTRWLKAAWFRFLGRRALRAQNLRTALADFQKAVEQQPGNPGSTLLTAWCLYSLKDYDAAIEQCDLVLQRDAVCAGAHAYRALALAGLHRLREAIEELRRARRMGLVSVKGHKDAGYWEATLGWWLADIGNHAEAMELLRRSIELRPNDAYTHHMLGFVYSELKRHEESIKQVQESIRLDPSQPEAYCALGVYFAAVGRLDEAVESYLQAIRLRPGYADAYVNLASAYSQAGRSEAAIATWKRVIEFEPNGTGGYEGIAFDLEQLGRLQDVLDAARELERIAPSAVSLGNVAVMLNRLDRFEEALRKAREAICLDPANACAHWCAAFALHSLRDPEAAIYEYRKALELEPDDLNTLINYGEAYLDLGRGQEALPLLQRAVELGPDSPYAHDALGLAHLAAGNREQALQEFQTIQRLDAAFEGHLGKQLASEKQDEFHQL